MKDSLQELYDSFNAPESAMDPIQIVRRYARVEDREIVAFVAAGLAFGRVASVMASIEAICTVMGPSPEAFVRSFDRTRDGVALKPFVHRWVKGPEVIGLFAILRLMIDEFGSLEACFASGYDDTHTDLAPAIEAFAKRGGKSYFFAKPSTGSACKRMNLFLRWMVRTDGVDPGGWTRIPASKLLVPLDTHTIRVGKCLRFTTRVSPGWKMAADITAALRRIDPSDPVRFDFALCHLSMMGACGFGAKPGEKRRGNADCPLKAHCKPHYKSKTFGLSGRRSASRKPSARR